MAVKSFKMGPGSLTLGTGGSALTVSAQVRSLTIRAAEKVERTEAVPVLSGEELAAEESTSYDWTMVGTVIQDLTAAGVLDWSWANKGTTQPFTFIPATAAGRKVTGSVIPAPLDLGGDVDKTKRPEAGFTWRLPTEPVLGATP